MKGSSILEINLEAIRDNTAKVVEICHQQDIAVLGVTKGFTAIHQIVAAMVEGGVDGLADSRMENILKLRRRGFNKPITLLRIPRLSNVKNVVRYADVSVNSEVAVMQALSRAALEMGKVHKVILMLDVGDLREGVMKGNILNTVRQIIDFHGIQLIGLGTNMGCFGGILPSNDNLGFLVEVKNFLDAYLGYDLEVISGGGTSTLALVEQRRLPAGINQLRVGEGILLGTDTTNSRKIPWLRHDAFLLRAEVIEVKAKPSVPIGEIGRDAFGNIPEFQDQGMRNRAILALGKQDVYVEGIIPTDEHMKILGASSDHLIVDVTDCLRNIRVGDEISFCLNYAGLLSACDSKYVKKRFKGG